MDAVEILECAISVAAAAGSPATLDYALDLAERMRRHLWAETDGFLDRTAAENGPLGAPERPFHENAAAARALLRLDAFAEAGGARAQAERILAFLSPAAGRYGIDGAAFALAAAEFFDAGPLVVVRAAPDGDAADARALTEAAVSRPGAKVWRLREDARIAGRAFAAEGPAEARVRDGLDWSAPVRGPTELRALVQP